jgi:uncharacterized protein (TIGR02117 family)
VFGAAVEGVASYVDSTAEIPAGKVANAALGAGAGALVMAKPVVAGAGRVAPDGYKLSGLYHGTAADQYPKRSRWEAPRSVRLFLALALTAACAACVASRPPSQGSIPRAQPPTVRVFIVVHRWHSGVVLPRAALAPAILPEVADFPDADYLEFGWGDRDYYEGKRGAWVILKAALWPTPGVLHVASCSGRVVTCFPYSRIVSLDMPDSALQRLSERLGGSFRRDVQPKAAPLGPGLYGESRFYPSREKFYLLKTCNSWTAGLLQAAGYPIRPASSLTVDAVMKQLKPYATLIQAPEG